MDREIVKYTLKSYIGDYVNISDYDKKAETLDKLKGLSVKDFDKFVSDIVNEIHRRTNLEYKKPGNHSMRKKLIQMKDDIFKNLVYDLIEVYNIRFPSNMDDEIENISQLINALKTEEDINEQICNESNIFYKYKLFLEYIKHKYSVKDDKLMDYMINFTINSLKEDVEDTCDIVFNYKLFIEKLNSSKFCNLEKFKFYRENIFRIENMNLKKSIKKDLIFGEFFNIIKLIIDNQYFFEEDEITRNINSFIEIVSDLQFNDEDSNFLKDKDFFNVGINLKKILESCKKIPFINPENLDRLENVKLKESYNYEDVMMMVSIIRMILEDIKHKKDI